MSYIANDPESYEGKVVGTGQCVAFVQAASGAPITSMWQQGISVKGNGLQLPSGVAIATFNADGKYANKMDGTSHGAIYIGQDATGIQVWDQWAGQPVHKRTIRFQASDKVKPVNNGNFYWVVE